MAATDKMAMTREQMEALGGVITGNVGKARILTSADYNWPTDNPTSVALWLLPAGIYTKIDSSVWVRSSTSANLGVGTFIVMPHSGSGVVAILTVQEGAPKQVDVSYTRTSNGTYLAGGGNVLFNSSVVNDLTSTDSGKPLSAAQGKVLKDMIDALPTGGGITELTSADYNYHFSGTTDDGVAVWLLDEGFYTKASGVKLYKASNRTTSSATAFLVIKDSTFTHVILNDSSDTVLGVVNSQGQAISAYSSILTGNNITQLSAGTSTTSVMSQNAVTSMVFADPATQYNVQIGANATASTRGVAIGRGAFADSNAISLGESSRADLPYSISLGSYSSATAKGQLDISTLRTTNTYGYNDSQYRLLTGLYDPQSAHDAATKGYVDGLVGNVASALNVINNGGNS